MTDGEPMDFAKLAGSIQLDILEIRDYATLFLPNLDYEAQLESARRLLWRHYQADELLSDEIKKMEAHARKTTGWQNERAVDDWVERLHASVYQDAAHSMAAVGMVAPLIESLFYQAFLGMEKYYDEEESEQASPLPAHYRWQAADKDKWDCHFVWEKGTRRKDLVEGIFQLVDAVGLNEHLSSDVRPRLKALFTYRNKMFHCGFVWPVSERKKFDDLLKKRGWMDWFRAATIDGEPWIYYMTTTFTSDCVATVDKIIEAFGAYARRLIQQRAQTSDNEH